MKSTHSYYLAKIWTAYYGFSYIVLYSKMNLLGQNINLMEVIKRNKCIDVIFRSFEQNKFNNLLSRDYQKNVRNQALISIYIFSILYRFKVSWFQIINCKKKKKSQLSVPEIRKDALICYRFLEQYIVLCSFTRLCSR